KFAFYSGLRTSELIGLCWDDIDWVNGLVHVCRAVVCQQVKGPKTKAGERDVLLLVPALEALKAQKQHTFLVGKRVFHNPRTNLPWISDKQIREQAWRPLLRNAGVRYRYPYQTRHTYASTMLSAGENMLWVSNQMGHVDVEMVMKKYGKWIPNSHSKVGYQLRNDWSEHCAV
ncbi:MAG: site-specific integrase, partial [Gammaproteobacteria bacterium]